MGRRQGGVTNMVHHVQNKAQQVLQLIPFIEFKQLEGILRPWREGNNRPVRVCH